MRREGDGNGGNVSDSPPDRWEGGKSTGTSMDVPMNKHKAWFSAMPGSAPHLASPWGDAISPALPTGSSPPPPGAPGPAPGSPAAGHIPAARPAGGPGGCHRIL